MEFGRETLHKYLLTKWILESERKEYVPWLEQCNFYEFIRSLFTLSPNSEEPQWHKEICCFSMAAVNTRSENWPLLPELPLFASNPFHSDHTQGCPCLLKVKCDPTMGKCPSQGTLLELVHVLLAKQQWSREKMHCPSRSWPRRHAEMAFPPVTNSSQRNQGAGHSDGNPWVPELFLHCGLCSLTRSVCGRPVSGRTRVGGHADSWFLAGSFPVSFFICLSLSLLSGLFSLSLGLSCLIRKAVLTVDSSLLFQVRKQFLVYFNDNLPGVVFLGCFCFLRSILCSSRKRLGYYGHYCGLWGAFTLESCKLWNLLQEVTMVTNKRIVSVNVLERITPTHFFVEEQWTSNHKDHCFFEEEP